MAELTAPKIDYYIDILKRGFVIGEEMKPYVDELFNELHKIAPCGNDNRRELWLFAKRGKIEDYGDYEEMYEYGEVGVRKINRVNAIIAKFLTILKLQPNRATLRSDLTQAVR